MRKQSGLTLIEMMVTVAVIIILLSAATLGYTSMVSRGTRDAVLSDLVFTLSLARTEAIKRSGLVSVCPSNNGSDCNGTWVDGWMMFVNTDGDSPPVRDSAEQTLRVFQTGRSGYAIGASAALASGLSFRGRGTPTQTGNLTVCVDEIDAPRRVVLSPIGIARIEIGDDCT